MVMDAVVETGADVRRRLASIFGGSIGNLIEWYDFYVYNAFALYFAKFFFPNSDPTAQFLNTFGIYALAFFVRPIGGWVIGAYADRKGRRAALTLSVLLMCAGSLLIGVIPSYAAIGAAAPVLLLVARVIQSISLGGEYGTSATYLSEVAGQKRRGFYSSFQYVTLIGGQIVASLVLLLLQQLLSAAQLEAWGWRIPFLLGAACALYGFYLRRNLIETDDFLRASKVARPNLFRELAKHPREILLVFGLTMGGTVAFYTYTTYIPTFLVNTVKLSRGDAVLISFITLTLYAALQPVFGWVSDRIGRKPVLLWFGVLGTLGTVPLLTALSQTRDFMTALLLGDGGAADRVRIHVDQCGGEGRAVPRRRAGAGRGPTVCGGGIDVRRHCALRGSVVQGLRARELVLLVCQRPGLRVARGLRHHAGHARCLADGGVAQPFTAGSSAISEMSLRAIASPKVWKSWTSSTKLPGPPETLSRYHCVSPPGGWTWAKV